MTVSPGGRLGPYEIQSAIGAGGMGEVYRARDLRLERDVALKVLPADTVAAALALKLLPAEPARLASAKAVDPGVYDLCLKGTYYAQRLARTDLDTAERYFQLVLATDPASAAAYAGMALVWGARQQMGWRPAGESGPKARAAALKAVELDDTLAKAHDRLAGVSAGTDFEWGAAEREYKRAIELDPNDPSSRAGYSHVLMILRRPGEAMRQIDRAIIGVTSVTV